MNQYQNYGNPANNIAPAPMNGQALGGGQLSPAAPSQPSMSPQSSATPAASMPAPVASPMVGAPPSAVRPVGMTPSMASPSMMPMSSFGGGGGPHAQYQSQRKFDFEKKLMEELIDYQKENYKLARDATDNITNIVEYQSYIAEKMRSMVRLQRFYFLWYPLVKLLLMAGLVYLSFISLKSLDINSLIQDTVDSAVSIGVSEMTDAPGMSAGGDTGGGINSLLQNIDINQIMQNIDPKQLEQAPIFNGANQIRTNQDAMNNLPAGPGVRR